MLHKFAKMQCRKCLYHLGVIKCIVSPCPMCKVYGGSNSPITHSLLTKDGITNVSKKNKVRRR